VKYFVFIYLLIIGLVFTGCSGIGPSLMTQVMSGNDLAHIDKTMQFDTSLLSAELIGRTVNKKKIVARIWGKGLEQILIFGAIHGDERLSATMLEEYELHLLRNPEVLNGKKVWIIPVLNPDGIKLWTRQNANGVDLNHNFPASNFQVNDPGRYYSGDRPKSEPETQALLKLIERIKPVRILSVHTPLGLVNWDGPAENLAQWMSAASGLPVVASDGNSPGSFGAWAGVDHHIPLITFELTENGWSNEDGLKKMTDAVDVFVKNQPFVSYF
jgi:murein peptide amidase A